MKKEKSCGAVVFRITDDKPEFLVIHQVQGHWCFPKGHVEKDETETETALREIREETGLDVAILDGFRTVTSYSPEPGVIKEVVYFLARPIGGKEKVQKEELQDMQWAEYVRALPAVTYENDAAILKKAARFLKVHSDPEEAM